MRFILSIFFLPILFSSPVFAGFEWVPPMSNPIVVPQVESHVENNAIGNDMEAGFPAPAVLSEPLLDNLLSHEPVSILTKNAAKNLSGKKLVIDPYPLQNNVVAPVSQVSMIEAYKAMSEESGNLHPVRLGNGMTTGAKKTLSFVPKIANTTSTAYRTALTPTGTGITPMRGNALAPLPSVAIPSKKYAEAVGFGRDLPLALALSQVIPAEFIHSFAKNVDAGVTVSWEGGRPWNQILDDMLSPKNLTAVIQGNQVIIQSMVKL